MKSKTWLILDCNYLMYRAYFTTGQLTQGAIYGFLRDVKLLQQDLGTTDIMFCWDLGEPLRRRIYPQYKLKRTSLPSEDRLELHDQMDALRRRILPSLGFRNIFAAEGYEADDLIASMVDSPEVQSSIIVSADKDLYQLLDRDTMIWNIRTGRPYTEEYFKKEYGISVRNWAYIKAIAGCPTDNVKGVKGVGEKTAAKYLMRKATTRATAAIESARYKWGKNIRLVKLPYPGTPVFLLQEDDVNPKRWREVTTKLGMPSISDYTPPVRSLYE